MRLGLSSAAAHDANIDALVDACARRGLGALELCAGDAHGLRADRTSRGSKAGANDPVRLAPAVRALTPDGTTGEGR